MNNSYFQCRDLTMTDIQQKKFLGREKETVIPNPKVN